MKEKMPGNNQNQKQQVCFYLKVHQSSCRNWHNFCVRDIQWLNINFCGTLRLYHSKLRPDMWKAWWITN